MLGDKGLVDATAGDQLVEEAQVEEDVRAGSDRDVFPGDLRRLRPPRVDDPDLAAPRLDLSQSLPRVRHLQEAPLRDDRIRPDDHQAFHVIEIRERLAEGEAVDLLRDGELVAAVLGRRGVHALRADAVHEALREDRMEKTEARGGPDVHADGVGAVVAPESLHLLADLLERLLPRDALEAVTDALHRVLEAIRTPEEPVLLEPLHAREALALHVVRVGTDRGDLPLAVDVDLETAEGFADPAEGVGRSKLGHVGSPGSRPPGRPASRRRRA